jgi:hypothetical protein
MAMCFSATSQSGYSWMHVRANSSKVKYFGTIGFYTFLTIQGQNSSKVKYFGTIGFYTFLAIQGHHLPTYMNHGTSGWKRCCPLAATDLAVLLLGLGQP